MRKQVYKRKAFHVDVSKWHSNNQYQLIGFDHGVISCDSKQITKNQVESCRKLLSRLFRRKKPRPSFKMFFNYSIALTKKASGARMGRGKGNLKNYVSKIKKNDLLFAFKKCNIIIAHAALTRIQHKLPFKLKLISYFLNGYCRYEDRCGR